MARVFLLILCVIAGSRSAWAEDAPAAQVEPAAQAAPAAPQEAAPAEAAPIPVEATPPRKQRRMPVIKDAEGTTAPNRFEAETVIKSRYSLEGKKLEVDPD